MYNHKSNVKLSLYDAKYSIMMYIPSHSFNKIIILKSLNLCTLLAQFCQIFYLMLPSCGLFVKYRPVFLLFKIDYHRIVSGL